MLDATFKFLRQIIPPVIATLIAAVLISAFNRAFSTHLTQPRMGGLQTEAAAAPEREFPRTIPAITTARPVATDRLALEERGIEPSAAEVKGVPYEAAKDQTAIKPVAPPVRTATAPAEPAKARPVPVARPEPRVVMVPVAEPAAPAVVAYPAAPPVTYPAPMPAPVAGAPAPYPAAAPAPYPVAVAPAPVVQAPRDPHVVAQPMVTVPDRERPAPVQTVEAEQVPPPPAAAGPLGAIVNVFKPSNIFARAREFGEKIEAVGNDILPNIRQ